MVRRPAAARLLPTPRLHRTPRAILDAGALVSAVPAG